MMNKIWYQDNALYRWFIPVSLVYQSIITVRRFLYRHQLKSTTQFPVPVIVVGNITVGGTGKTPLVIYLTRLLQQYGYRPGIVSRGYKSQAPQYPYLVTMETPIAYAGDEALLLARRTQVPVVIAPSRVQAAQYLLDHHECDCVISDDGLQHYALERTLEIAVIDGQRRIGNGYCLPAGPLREPAQRLAEVDLLVCNGEPQPGEFAMRLQPRYFVNVLDAQQKVAIDFFQNQSVHAVAGIGNPQRFFDMLHGLQVDVIPHVFPDHYAYQTNDIAWSDPVIMTEKDAVKCVGFAQKNYWYLAVDAVLDDSFGQILKQKLDVSCNSPFQDRL